MERVLLLYRLSFGFVTQAQGTDLFSREMIYNLPQRRVYPLIFHLHHPLDLCLCFWFRQEVERDRLLVVALTNERFKCEKFWIDLERQVRYVRRDQ